MTVEVEFYGGPHDGRIGQLSKLLPIWRLPVPLSVTYDPVPEPAGLLPTFPVAEYELAFDPVTHRPSINNDGRHRYNFVRYEYT